MIIPIKINMLILSSNLNTRRKHHFSPELTYNYIITLRLPKSSYHYFKFDNEAMITELKEIVYLNNLLLNTHEYYGLRDILYYTILNAYVNFISIRNKNANPDFVLTCRGQDFSDKDINLAEHCNRISSIELPLLQYKYSETLRNGGY